MTSAETYYRCSLAVPLLVPLGALAVRAAAGTLDWEAGSAGLLALTLVFGGVPYLLTAALLLWRMRGMDAARMARLSWFAPLLMAAVTVACAALYLALGFRETADFDGGAMGLIALSGVAALMAFASLVFGYAYVALVHAALALLRALRLVRGG